jgi:hypothetical protein
MKTPKFVGYILIGAVVAFPIHNMWHTVELSK